MKRMKISTSSKKKKKILIKSNDMARTSMQNNSKSECIDTYQLYENSEKLHQNSEKQLYETSENDMINVLSLSHDQLNIASSAKKQESSNIKPK